MLQAMGSPSRPRLSDRAAIGKCTFNNVYGSTVSQYQLLRHVVFTKATWGICLVVQWLRHSVPTQGALVQFPVGGLELTYHNEELARHN